MSVPSDIAVVSFDNLDFIEALDPPVTTLSKTEPIFGETATDLLLRRIGGDDGNERIVLRSSLVTRGSCGCNESSSGSAGL